MKQTIFIKKCTAILTLIGIITMPLWSQKDNAWYLRMGTNHAKWRTTKGGVEKFDSYATFQTYLFISAPFEFGINKYFAVQVEPGLTQKGAKINYTGGIFHSVPSNLKITYFELPLLLKLKVGDPDLRLNAVLGPSFGYGLNGRIKEVGSYLKATRQTVDTELVLGTTGVYSVFDFSICTGLGMSFNKFGLDLRYVLGLKNLGSGGDGGAKFYNEAIQVGLSFKMPNSKNIK